MPVIIPNSFVPANPAIAGDVNANFQAVKVFVDAIETGVNIENSAITTAKIADNAITQAKLNDRVVGSAELSNLTLNPVVDTYTVQLSDAHKVVTLNKATAFTVTVPLDSTALFQIGDQVNLLQTGVGQVTVAGDAGVTLSSQGSKLKLNGQFSIATLIKVAANSWVLVGNTVA
jgi:hypothetical protein